MNGAVVLAVLSVASIETLQFVPKMQFAQMQFAQMQFAQMPQSNAGSLWRER